MLHFTLKISNLWGSDQFKNLFCKSGMITKHKAWEFEIIKYSKDLVNIALSVTTERDHAGVTIELGLFSYTASLKLYDTRHWDHEWHTWETDEQPN